MNEADTRAELIDPQLKAAGWNEVEGSRIRREYKNNYSILIAPGPNEFNEATNLNAKIVMDNGKSIKMQPGLNASFANKILEPYNRKIGPDPASIKSACIGGIISNNSSGMVCGTKYNSYHTLKDLEFILPNGNEYDTANPEERLRFIKNEPKLNRTILKIRKQILSNKKLINKIRNKYRIKNTIGYSMNSFIDFDDPLDIFSHLLVGAEGTLAFISSITLNTIDDPPEKGTGLIIFNSPDAASNSLKFFKNIGASAIELMDDSSLKTASYLENPPYNPQNIQQGDTGLLVEFQNNKISEKCPFCPKLKGRLIVAKR